MIYFEKLGITQLLTLWLTKKQVFYGSNSMAMRVFEKLNIRVNAKQISFGDVQAAPNIRRNAYQTAELQIGKLRGNLWAAELSKYLGIDFELIFRKFIFDELYTKYEFIELALRHALENGDGQHIVHLDRNWLEPYADRLRACMAVKYFGNFESFYFFSVLLLPIYLRYFWRSNRSDDELIFENRIVCEVDGEKLYEMFCTIFHAYPAKIFVIEKRYAGGFEKRKLKESGIKVLGLTHASYRYLSRAAYKYIFLSFKHFGEMSIYGGRLFRMFHYLMVGRAEAVQGSGNLFFTYEHSVIFKAIRNEFLRAEGSRSIFVPMNAHATPRYYHSEIFVNYDVICSAGKHTDELYRERKSVTNIFLPTGTYDSHRGTIDVQGKAARIARLMSFKGDSVAITILSPGICDPTYSHEVRLMSLARALANQSGVKVIIRLKPFLPDAKYADFYDVQTAGCGSILLTFSEFELVDFLDVTDLFITSISNSGCDLALCGGQVMFIDYLEDPDLFLYWATMKEVVLSEEESLAAIMDWVKDGKLGQSRAELKGAMHRLADYLGYRFPDFDSYRENLIAQMRLTFIDHPALRCEQGVPSSLGQTPNQTK